MHVNDYNNVTTKENLNVRHIKYITGNIVVSQNYLVIINFQESLISTDRAGTASSLFVVTFSDRTGLSYCLHL